MLTVFGNLKISDETKLQHLKDSFFSFSKISDDWLINIRGKFRDEAIAFFRENIREDEVRFFDLQDDARGWTVNALEMLPKAKHDYLLIWNEDHLNIAPQEFYRNIIEEMKEKSVDCLPYSWWLFGKVKGQFGRVGLEKGRYIDFINLTEEKWEQAGFSNQPYYIVSLTSIFSRSFFEKMMRNDRRKLSVFDVGWIIPFLKKASEFLGVRSGREKWFDLVNRLFFGRKLRKFSQETPFDLEYESHRLDTLPIKIAFPKQELFACIDDDTSENGYQLIKRGLYPPDYRLDLKVREGRPDLVGGISKEISFWAGEKRRFRYYEDDIRTRSLIEEKLFVKNGKVSVSEKNKIATVTANHFVGVFPNLGYEVGALEDSVLEVVTPDLAGKKIAVLE